MASHLNMLAFDFYGFLFVRNDRIQNVFPAEIEMCFSRNESAFGFSRVKRRKIFKLLEYPRSSFYDFFLNEIHFCTSGGCNENRKLGRYGYPHRFSLFPSKKERNLLGAVQNPFGPYLHCTWAIHTTCSVNASMFSKERSMPCQALNSSKMMSESSILILPMMSALFVQSTMTFDLMTDSN